MKRGIITVFIAVLMVMPLVITGCKGKAEREGETPAVETTEATVPAEDVVVTQAPVVEQTAPQEMIPPTAALPPGPEQAMPADKLSKNKDIQTALKAAGFYTGNVDGKIGPKTKKAIVEFQRAKGLKADGRVGPKTWAELEKYLVSQ